MRRGLDLRRTPTLVTARPGGGRTAERNMPSKSTPSARRPSGWPQRAGKLKATDNSRAERQDQVRPSRCQLSPAADIPSL